MFRKFSFYAGVHVNHLEYGCFIHGCTVRQAPVKLIEAWIIEFFREVVAWLRGGATSHLAWILSKVIIVVLSTH